MSALAIFIVFPLTTAALLLYFRGKHSMPRYVAISIPFLAIGVAVWLSRADVIYRWEGRLNAEGFESWGFVVGVVCLVAICAIPLRSMLARIGQGVGAFVAFNFSLLLAGWVA
jgi:hypothetical protein